MPSIASPVLHEDDGLAAGSLSPFEVLAQSVSGIAPSAAASAGTVLVATTAGGAVVYSFIASTIVLMLVGWCINKFVALKGAGTLMDYIAITFGPGAGFVGSIGLAFGYVLIADAALAGLVLYTAPLLGLVGIPTGGKVVALLVIATATIVATIAMIRGVELSTRAGVILEAVSITLLVVLLAIVVLHTGFHSAPFHLPGTTAGSTATGMVLAILSYVGFESAACMGTEARDAAHSIPRAVVLSVVIAGALYIVSSYVQLDGFGGTDRLLASAAPLNDLADGARVHFMGYVMDIGICASFFACVTGSLNAASRLLHAMGQQQLLHGAIGVAHPRHRTPHLAIYLLAAVTFLVPAVMTLAGTDAITIYALVGTIGTYGYMFCYLLVAIACPIMVWRAGKNAVPALAIGGPAAAGLLYVAYHSLYPVPPAPYKWLPWEFLAVLLVAAVWYAARGRLSHHEYRTQGAPTTASKYVPVDI